MPHRQERQRASRVGAPRWLQAWRVVLPFGRRHYRLFLVGALAALVVVGIRLVLPWPLKALMEPWLGKTPHGRSAGAAGLLHLVPHWLDPTVAMGGLFLVLICALGFADYLERLYFARFAIGSIRDLRAEAFRRVRLGAPHARAVGTGDLVARLIGDTVRIKTGLKGFLVHVATNGVMLVGISIVMLWINVQLGLIFVVAGFLVGCTTVWGAWRTYHCALKFRTKEGKLADFIQDSWQSDASSAFGEVNRSSGQHEATLTHIQGTATWMAHIILGLAVVSVLAYGAYSVSTGRVTPGEFFVVMMYGLTVRSPIVQLARQGARTGKILACGDRLERLLARAPGAATDVVQPLRDELRVDGVRVATKRARTRFRRLGTIDLRIPAGQRVALLGKPGSGKTTLLELLAGVQAASHGRVLWDGRDLTGDGVVGVSEEVAFLPHDPTWPRRRVKDLLNLDKDVIDEDTRGLLRACGANSLLKRLPGELDAKLASSDLSPRERVALALATLVRGAASLWLLDDPVGALEKRKARKLIKRILDVGSNATMIVSLCRPVRLKAFDRVIVLKRGNVVFGGTPAMWRADSSEQTVLETNVTEESAPRTGWEEPR